MDLRLGLLLAVFCVLLSACSDDEEEMEMEMEMEMEASGPLNVISEDAQIWTGDLITFNKEANADITLAENQDMITPNVIITRGNNGGQIFNLAVEENSVEASSPAGTEWAEGTIDNIENMEFTTFRVAVNNSPQNATGTPLVAHLIEDDIFLSFTITSWSMGRNSGGQVTYERSTPE